MSETPDDLALDGIEDLAELPPDPPPPANPALEAYEGLHAEIANPPGSKPEPVFDTLAGPLEGVKTGEAVYEPPAHVCVDESCGMTESKWSGRYVFECRKCAFYTTDRSTAHARRGDIVSATAPPKVQPVVEEPAATEGGPDA